MQMKMKYSGFDGVNRYDAGVCDVTDDHARLVFVLGHGRPQVGKKNMPFTQACDLFRLQPDERVTAALNHGVKPEGK